MPNTKGIAKGRYPRASGDRPFFGARTGKGAQVPPRQRGSAPFSVRTLRGCNGTPAPAGIGPDPAVGVAAGGGYPRASGDRPNSSPCPFNLHLVPPRQRGSAAFPAGGGDRGFGTPAPAGIGLLRYGRIVPCPRYPRASGDRPRDEVKLIPHLQVPPRQRGSASILAKGSPDRAGTPASAGIGPTWLPPFATALGYPRVSGDRPRVVLLRQNRNKVPPRQRGSASYHHRTPSHLQGTPASAGIGPPSMSPVIKRKGYPRVSGDRPVPRRLAAERELVPPRQRGSAVSSKSLARSFPGTPASAGIGPAIPLVQLRLSGYPRVSGDRPQEHSPPPRSTEVPPRQRGSAPRPRLGKSLRPGTPASAGIGRGGITAPDSYFWYPRVSGDRPIPMDEGLGSTAVPPRQRGSASSSKAEGEEAGGTPASAGIGPFGAPASRTLLGYPRVSGDRPPRHPADPRVGLVPPRQRGSAPGRTPLEKASFGTPASAGIGRASLWHPEERGGYPRVSGDRPRLPCLPSGSRPVPPRQRGSASHEVQYTVKFMGTPASAGIGLGLRADAEELQRYPRVSGDRPRHVGPGKFFCRVPPRQRGSAR